MKGMLAGLSMIFIKSSTLSLYATGKAIEVCTFNVLCAFMRAFVVCCRFCILKLLTEGLQDHGITEMSYSMPSVQPSYSTV